MESSSSSLKCSSDNAESAVVDEPTYLNPSVVHGNCHCTPLTALITQDALKSAQQYNEFFQEANESEPPAEGADDGVALLAVSVQKADDAAPDARTAVSSLPAQTSSFADESSHSSSSSSTSSRSSHTSSSGNVLEREDGEESLVGDRSSIAERNTSFIASVAASSTPYHTFYPPVSSRRRREVIVQRILGRPPRSYAQWEWQHAEEFDRLPSKPGTTAAAAAPAYRDPNATSSLTVADSAQSAVAGDGDDGAARDSPAHPLAHLYKRHLNSAQQELGGSNSSGCTTPALHSSFSLRLTEAAAPRREAEDAQEPHATAESCTFPASLQGPEYFSRSLETDRSTLVIIMVGLPACGKTFLAQRICRLLGWHGARAKVLNVQAAWRQRLMGLAATHTPDDGETPLGADTKPHSSCYLRVDDFKQLIRDGGSVARRQYLETLRAFALDCQRFFRSGGEVLVVNDDFPTAALRDEVRALFQPLCSQLCFMEVSRRAEDNARLNQFKVQDPLEYPENVVPRDVARRDFDERVQFLESVYEPLADAPRRPQCSDDDDDDDSGAEAGGTSSSSSTSAVATLGYIKILDNGVIESRGVYGSTVARIISYTMSISRGKVRNPIFFTRHGQSCSSLENRIGGDPLLSAGGMRDAAALLEFLASLKEHVRHGRHASTSLEDGQRGGSRAATREPPRACRTRTHNTVDGRSPRLEIWTSQLRRAIQTAELSERLLNIRTLRWSSLNEIHAGVCEGMTEDEVRQQYPLIQEFRSENKYTFRYPEGESYQDIVARLEPVIMELENSDKMVVVVAHRAILRCLLAYFGSTSAESSVRVNVPHHTVWRCTYDSKGIAYLDKTTLGDGALASPAEDTPDSTTTN